MAGDAPERMLGAILDALGEVERDLHPHLTVRRWPPWEAPQDLPMLYHTFGDEGRGTQAESTHSDSVELPLTSIIALEPTWMEDQHAQMEALLDVYIWRLTRALRDFDDLVPACTGARIVSLAIGEVALAGQAFPAVSFGLVFDLDIRFRD